VEAEIAMIEIVTRNETGDIGHDHLKRIETETEIGTGIEIDMTVRVVNEVAGAMTYENETWSETGNLREEGEEMSGGIEITGTPGVEWEGGEVGQVGIGIKTDGIGNGPEKIMVIGGFQEVEVRHGM
jgi:hypothetical protein